VFGLLQPWHRVVGETTGGGSAWTAGSAQRFSQDGNRIK
jgi:hypothetical protein